MKTILSKIRILFVLLLLLANNTAMSQNKKKINKLKQQSKDSLIRAAIKIMQDEYPEICTAEKGFKAENFEKITVVHSKNKNGGDLKVYFNQIFNYMGDEKDPLIYAFSVSLISKSTSISISPDNYDLDDKDKAIMFYKSTEKSNRAIEDIVNAYYKKVEGKDPVEKIYQSLWGIDWDIYEKGDHCEIVSDSWNTRGWMSINKKDLTIYDERHKHYQRGGKEQDDEIIDEAILRFSPPTLNLDSNHKIKQVD